MVRIKLKIMSRTTITNRLVLPTYADNSAAIAGWLTVTTLYKTATWEVRIVV